VTCVGVPNDGRTAFQALDEIKSDLIKVIREAAADTLLLSLSSPAKILCQEIATRPTRTRLKCVLFSRPWLYLAE
jgi:hypothetical protein